MDETKNETVANSGEARKTECVLDLMTLNPLGVIPMSWNILQNGKKATESVKVEGDVATIQHATVHPVVAPKSKGQRIQLTWTFGYTGVTRKELIELATKTLVIAKRVPFKALDNPDPKDWNGAKFEVRTYLDEERRQPVDLPALVLASLQKLPADVAAEIVRKYQEE